MSLEKLLETAADIRNRSDEIQSLKRELTLQEQSLQEDCLMLGEVAKLMGVTVSSSNMVEFANMIIMLHGYKPIRSVKEPMDIVPALDSSDFVSELVK